MKIKEGRLHELMDRYGLQGVLLKRAANCSWFTGGRLNLADSAAGLSTVSLLVTLTGRYVIAGSFEGSRALAEEGLAELGFELVYSEWFEGRETGLIARMVNGNLGKVGADVNFAVCVNIGNDIKQMRYRLTESEIDRYLFFGEKFSQAVERGMLEIKQGATEREVAGRISALLWAEGIEPVGLTVTSDQRIFTCRQAMPTAHKIERCVMASVIARYKGLLATITRMRYFGRPTDRLQRQYQDNVTIECQMILATKPGIPAVEGMNAGLAAYTELGYKDEWRVINLGGAMGYKPRDFIVTPQTTEIVADNQAYCWNPSITGTRTEDGFIATTKGPLMITKPVLYPQLVFEHNGIKLVRPGLYSD